MPVSKHELHVSVHMQDDRIALRFANPTDTAVRIWEFHNAWGWDALALTVKSLEAPYLFTLMKRQQMGWTKSGPSFTEIPAFGRYTQELLPREAWWESDGDVALVKDHTLLVKAVLEIPESPEAETLGVFVGRVESEWVRAQPPHHWLFPVD